jgi:hypothetical protein
MTGARWLLLGIIAGQAAVQAQLVVVRPADETPIVDLLDVGAAVPGDILDTRLRIRNMGASAATLSVLRIRGTGFTLEGTPALPQLMAPGVNADFRVRFRPTGPGTFSATLEVNGTSLLVRGSAAAGLVLLRDGVAVTNDKTLEFGTVYVGQRGRIPLVLRNDSAQDTPVRQLSVTGAGLSLAPSPLPSFLRAGEEAPFELRCEPPRAGAVTGTLQLDTRAFPVAALGREPEAPDAWIELDPQAARSGHQSSLRVRLAAAAPMAVTGTLRLEFTPSVSAPGGDSAIQFLANSARTVDVRVEPGQSTATASGKADIAFQTGSTAGTAVFRLTLGSQEREVRVVLPPESPLIDAVEMQKGQGTVEVSVTGFDNHRSAGNIVFTFTDQAGQELPAVSAEAGAAFTSFFRDSTMGGLFRLTARFPVTGDASRLARVAVRLANGIGVGSGRTE